MTTPFSAQLAAANAALKKLRGDRTSPERLLCELREAGCRLGVDGGGLVVSGRPVPEALRPRVKELKAELMRLLSGPAAAAGPDAPPTCPWNDERGAELAGLAVKRFEQQGWPDPTVPPRDANDRDRELWRAFDRIDAAFLQKNLPKLEAAVEALLVNLDGVYPRRQGGLVLYEPSNSPVLWTGWVRTGKKQPWLPVARDVESEQECSDFLSEYAAEFKHLDVTVLPSGKNPNDRL